MSLGKKNEPATYKISADRRFKGFNPILIKARPTVKKENI